MSASTSLQIPAAESSPGPSRQQYSSSTSSRPVSVSVHSPSATSPSATSRKQRASHTVVSSTGQQQSHQNSSSGGHRGQEDNNPPYTDVYNHPAAVAYASAHPRRTIPKFGPYLLLQTLGEGEFGKVKLGLHSQWGEEVAVKLIRRGNVDSAVRMSKVEREIEVLRTLKHPNIVRLYDVIETDKYIGIIIEYASGGELFDHILAHRYLREKDAAKLFSQLISGVWYIHQKKIVHRDLKLENLLLDRHRNVIITDFGFANRFEHRADDLMQTSCGSPCYAAPELVISEGLYVGSAVDIWSCGVILYAMLAGYLPFDDDPANPDGDNINLLYKYIVSTPLSFPDYISDSARDLLSMMLVPDPSRRASLENIMRHPWLAAYDVTPLDPSTRVPTAFGRTVEELERAAMDQHHQKRLAYQRQMKAAAAVSPLADRATRSQSHRPETYANGSAPGSASVGPSTRSQSIEPAAFYETSTDYTTMHSVLPATSPPTSGGRGPKSSYGMDIDDPFAAPPGTHSSMLTTPTVLETPADKKKASVDRPHTVQVEYDGSRGGSRRERERERGVAEESRERTKHKERSRSPGHRQGSSHAHIPPSSSPVQERRQPSQTSVTIKPLPPSPAPANTPASPSRRDRERPKDRGERSPKSSTGPGASRSNSIPTPATTTPSAAPEPPSITLASPPDTPIQFASPTRSAHTNTDKDTQKSGSQSSSGSKHKRGASSGDRLAKLFGSEGSSVSESNPPSSPANTSGSLLSPVAASEKDSSSAPSNGKKSRRNTLTVMVEPFKSTIKGKKGRMSSTPVSAVDMNLEGGDEEKRGRDATPQPRSAIQATSPAMDSGADVYSTPRGRSAGLQASTNKAIKVMQWFRNKSKARDSVGVGIDTPEEEEKVTTRAMTPTQNKYSKKNAASTSTVNQTSAASPAVETPPGQLSTIATPRSSSRSSAHPQRTPSSTTEASTATPSFVARFRNSVTVGGSNGSSEKHHAKAAPGQLRVHHGAVDQSTVTTRPPPEVMKHIQDVLIGMGVEVQIESEFKFRCIRIKKRRAPSSTGSVGFMGGSGNGLAAFTMVGSAASNGVDRRGLPVPSHASFSSSGGMLRGLLMRRQSSQVSSGVGSTYDDDLPSASVIVGEPGSITEPLYGDTFEDVGDEVKFSVELTRLSGLTDMYSVDIRRLKGNLRSYKFLYDTIRVRADLQS